MRILSIFGILSFIYAVIIFYSHSDNIGLIISSLLCFCFSLLCAFIEHKKEIKWIKENKETIDKMTPEQKRGFNEPWTLP